MTQARQCSLEESMILTNVSFSPVYFCPKTPVLNWKETQACDCKILNHPSGCVCGPWPAKQAVGKHVPLYQSQKRLLFLRSNMKNFVILKGEPFPSKKNEISQLQKHLSLREITGFLTSKTHDHMPNLHWFACTKLNPKANNRGHQPPKISKET